MYLRGIDSPIRYMSHFRGTGCFCVGREIPADLEIINYPKAEAGSWPIKDHDGARPLSQHYEMIQMSRLAIVSLEIYQGDPT